MIDDLRAELGRVGIRGRARRRILDEFADHLTCDPGAELGRPHELARQFADELGTSRSRAAAYTAFGCLALTGVLYTATFVALAVAGPPVRVLDAHIGGLGDLATALTVLGPQVAFVAGGLALLRALRFRRERTVAAAEVQVLVRRAAVALAAGLATVAGLALFAYEYAAGLPNWLELMAYVSAAVGGAALVAAGPRLVAAARVQVSTGGGAGDVFDDLGPVVPSRLRGRPWAFALTVAAAIALAITAAGVVQADPFDGALRGILDGLACLTGFAVLGRFLALRPPKGV